jgi:hypothetical protein
MWAASSLNHQKSASRTERPWLRISVAKAVRFLPLDRCLEATRGGEGNRDSTLNSFWFKTQRR